MMYPLPLHEFFPLQSLPEVAVLQALCPLHAFPPTHLICVAADAPGVSSARATLLVNANATAVASIAPAIRVFFIAQISLQGLKSGDKLQAPIFSRFISRAPEPQI
jgi:hypothetical protein